MNHHNHHPSRSTLFASDDFSENASIDDHGHYKPRSLPSVESIGTFGHRSQPSGTLDTLASGSIEGSPQSFPKTPDSLRIGDGNMNAFETRWQRDDYETINTTYCQSPIPSDFDSSKLSVPAPDSIGTIFSVLNYYLSMPQPGSSSSATFLSSSSSTTTLDHPQTPSSEPSILPIQPLRTKSSVSSLLGVSVTLTIDQGAFRAVNIVFQPCRVYDDEPAIGSDGLVHFSPLSHEALPYHYSPFDVPPKIRRISTSFSDSKDHLTRDAHLQLKSNSLYSIQGSEVPVASRRLSNSKPKKLFWRFDYAVDDQSSPKRRLLKGEKMLRPLEFSCSPDFLLPSQGRKVTIWHVLRKVFTPKVTAKRLLSPRQTSRISMIPLLWPTSAGSQLFSSSSVQADYKGSRSSLTANPDGAGLSTPSSTTQLPSQPRKQILQRSQLNALMEAPIRPVKTSQTVLLNGLTPPPPRSPSAPL